MIPKIGEFVQWESGGFLMFKPLRKVINMSPCQKFCFVEGSGTGIPVSEIVEVHKEREPKPTSHVAEWKRLCHRLHELMKSGHGPSDEAERIREQMNLHWYCLAESEMNEVNEFNIALYERDAT